MRWNIVFNLSYDQIKLGQNVVSTQVGRVCRGHGVSGRADMSAEKVT